MLFNQIVAKDILTNAGAKVDIAENGAIAVDKILNNSYDLVIMDVQMPIMDGYEATRRIREMDANLNKYTKVIALTANALKGDREKCINAGMNDYLAKPITPDALINKMIEWLEPGKYALSTIDTEKDDGIVEVNPLDGPLFDKKALLLELNKLKLALVSGKISKIKELIQLINENESIMGKLKDDLAYLTTQVDDYDFDEAVISVAKIIKTAEDGDYE